MLYAYAYMRLLFFNQAVFRQNISPNKRLQFFNKLQFLINEYQ